MNKINLGDRAKDTVSGFEGIAVARHTYLQGCDRVSLQPPIDKDGKHLDPHTFDEPQLEIVQAAVVKPDPLPQQQRTGGAEKYSDQGRDC